MNKQILLISFVVSSLNFISNYSAAQDAVSNTTTNNVQKTDPCVVATDQVRTIVDSVQRKCNGIIELAKTRFKEKDQQYKDAKTDKKEAQKELDELNNEMADARAKLKEDVAEIEKNLKDELAKVEQEKNDLPRQFREAYQSKIMAIMKLADGLKSAELELESKKADLKIRCRMEAAKERDRVIAIAKSSRKNAGSQGNLASGPKRILDRAKREYQTKYNTCMNDHSEIVVQLNNKIESLKQMAKAQEQYLRQEWEFSKQNFEQGYVQLDGKKIELVQASDAERASKQSVTEARVSAKYSKLSNAQKELNDAIESFETARDDKDIINDSVGEAACFDMTADVDVQTRTANAMAIAEVETIKPACQNMINSCKQKEVSTCSNLIKNLESLGTALGNISNTKFNPYIGVIPRLGPSITTTPSRPKVKPGGSTTRLNPVIDPAMSISTPPARLSYQIDNI